MSPPERIIRHHMGTTGRSRHVLCWCESNSHFFRDSKYQYPLKVNVYEGIVGDNMISHIFQTENVNGHLYLKTLQDAIDQMYIEVAEN